MATVGTVRLTRVLYARFRLLAYELGKFGIVGVASGERLCNWNT